MGGGAVTGPPSVLHRPLTMITAHRALRRGRTTPAPPRRRLVWLISATDGHDHAVTLEEMETGITAGQGTYRAACGHPVLVCAMATPPGPRCRSCDQPLPTPPPRKRGWTAALRSVLRHHPEPTVAKHRPP